jgi:DNA-binding transcriptional LysR family regulator
VIELRQLRHFLAVVERGGVRRAARHIPLSPSAVARSVKTLEEHFGVPLMVRRGKHVEPTAFGRQLAEEARTLVAGFEGIESRLGQLADLSRGHLRVGISPSVADVFLPRVGARFLRDYPGTSMETRTGHATEMLGWLVGREVDVVVGEQRPFAIHGGLNVTTLYSEEVPFWVRDEHPLANKKDVGAADLIDYPVVSQYLPAPFQAWFEGLCRSAAQERAGGRVNHAQQCTSYNILVRLALDSDAVLLAPSLNVLTGPWADRFVRLPIPVIGTAHVCAATLRSPSPPPLARRFVDLLREACDTVRRESVAR